MADDVDPTKPTTETTTKTTASPAAAEPVEDLVSTEHTLKLGRKSLRYTATAGRITLREEKYEDDVFQGAKPKAQVFLTSYVAHDAGENRPVTFAFNGGPGSSSVWLHLGLLGPRRVDSGDVGELTKPPYGLIDNAESILAVSDLVMIDPITTGFSRAVEGGKPDPYLGYTGDIESIAEVIRLWTSRNNRWLSPKFVLGESYGTTRAGGLAEYLQERHSYYLNGVMLISSILDYGTVGYRPAEGASSPNFLPTYAAIAWYHGKHGRKPLQDVLDEAEAYALTEYPRVLRMGHRLPAAERVEAVATIARLTGLSERYVDLADLQLEHIHFFTELLRDERLVVGRLDSRYIGPAASGIAEKFEADPFSDATGGPYAAAWNSYVRGELGYRSDSSYDVYSPIAWKKWSYKEFENQSVDSAGRLARAMRMNPQLKVYVAYGYFDGATPYFAAEDVFAHLNVPAELAQRNIEHKYYEAGHMMYVHQPSRLQQAAHLADFIRRSC